MLALNTGFMVLRNSAATHSFLTDIWNLGLAPDSDCPINWLGEQGKMNACVLPYLTPGVDYFVLPCDSFNGYGLRLRVHR